jgi:Polyketide cyclase / dehydrase and lipid transport
VTSEELFWQLAEPLLGESAVTRSAMMGLPCLRLDGRFFASLDRRTQALLIKLPAERVQALIVAGSTMQRRFPARESPPAAASRDAQPMSSLTQHIVIDAPADTVWEAIADGFDRIGEWAAAIPASAPAIAGPGGTDLAAPVPARVCQTGIRALPRVTETIVGFDAANRTLTYQATAGLPPFVTTARNTWTITALSATQCRVDIAAEFTTRGIFGWLTRTVILARVLRDGRHVLDDLRHYIETGTPSPRKLSRQQP